MLLPQCPLANTQSYLGDVAVKKRHPLQDLDGQGMNFALLYWCMTFSAEAINGCCMAL